MALTFYGHPFSSYCQKALIALYENDTPFTFEQIDLGDPESAARLEALWPMRRFPVLVDDGQVVVESTIIIEHLALHHPGPVNLVPPPGDGVLAVRGMDRFFDNFIATPQMRLVFDALRPAEHRDPYGVEEARGQLETAYRWLDGYMDGREWAAGASFSLADCAAAPSLFYADWSHPIPESLVHLKAYRQRLLRRPSFARAVDDARPYREFFPLGAPDRD